MAAAWLKRTVPHQHARETLEAHTRFLGADAAMVHSRFRVSGDVEENGKAVAREGVGVRVVRKIGGRWFTVAVQNTDIKNRRTWRRRR